MDRRAFLQSFLRAPKRPGAGVIRPPYAPPGTDFSACAHCDAPCVPACPQGILERDADGAPVVRFRGEGCTFCTACADACPHGVLSPDGPARIPARAHIDPGRCTAWQRVLCFVCLEACPEEAIRFKGMLEPTVLAERCTGCGRCLAPCPTGAIRVE
ncbi:ferredoxin-type protein NapF [Marinithermus hydrothermalis]|uniref:4Fe-4S ferredoxin iron-sulfur binding domain-containing protein n=1 Tax=Marinithermus hydrothermalis (strain DSM 14884 / JCM 11576 / T1) TaxID=869210 RepID=F2NPP0_MARHT|nr:ferredoxin-type protein NapF [Marinithermus hydrothermalis]AEB12541.1 4Fe-4S ferredoxin iron-sulfur binding domain-containing protein [Marinithermus hydrothermalis DSM 14884]